MGSQVTYTGRYFNPANPKPSSVDIDDVAHALAHINRFNGHARFAWSVAQHSLAVSHYLLLTGEAPEICLAGLLHDAHKAYFGDIGSPLKTALGLESAEARIQAVVAEGLHISPALLRHPAVRKANQVARAKEAETLFVPKPTLDDMTSVTSEMLSLMAAPTPENPILVRAEFLEHHLRLCREVQIYR